MVYEQFFRANTSEKQYLQKSIHISDACLTMFLLHWFCLFHISTRLSTIFDLLGCLLPPGVMSQKLRILKFWECIISTSHLQEYFRLRKSKRVHNHTWYADWLKGLVVPYERSNVLSVFLLNTSLHVIQVGWLLNHSNNPIKINIYRSINGRWFIHLYCCASCLEGN